MKNTSHLGRKDARNKGARGERSSPWTKGLGGRVHAGLDGNPATQGSAPRMRDAMQEISLAFSSKEPPDRCRAHLEEESLDLFINAQMPMVHEVLHEEGHACSQTDWSQEGAGTPDGDECLLHIGTIPGRTVSPLSMFVQCEGCTGICFAGSATRTQSPRRYRCPAWCRTRDAYLRQYPVDGQKSSSICDFLLFVAFQYACAFTNVSFFRSRIVSSTPAAPFSSQGPAVFCHRSRTFSREFTGTFQVHSR